MKYLIVSLSLVMVVACAPSSTTGPDPGHPNPGTIHNEYLATVHAALDALGGPSTVSPVEEGMVLLDVTNRMLERFDEEPVTTQDINAALDWGRKVAAMDDPWILVQPLVSASDWKWLNRYIDTATPVNARAVYDEHCRLYGEPEEGSMLWYCLDVTIASAEYWTEYAMSRPVNKDGFGGPQLRPKWLDNVIRFVTVTAVDGITGVATASAVGGLGGFWIGAACSYAVNDLIWGNGYGAPRREE